MPRPRVRTEQLRAHLLDMAMKLLAEGGPAAVTTRAVAARANTSAPAIYELFGDKAGLVRALFFEGFRRLNRELDALPEATGELDDILAMVSAFRRFTVAQPHLFEVMYSRPFDAFTPTPDERRLGNDARSQFVEAVQRSVDLGMLDGDATDIAHALLGLAIGLATQETAGWLGSHPAIRSRRWNDATAALLDGFRPS